MSIATDLQNTLDSLKKEYGQIISRGNPDRMEEFLRRSLSAYHDDILYARRSKILTKEQVDYFNHEYCMIADNIQDAKREQKRKDDFQKNKRSLGSVHKIVLPQLKDSLDGGPWKTVITQIT